MPSSVYTSDLDGDGDVDIIVANASSNAVSILRNDGGLSFVRLGDIGGGSGFFFSPHIRFSWRCRSRNGDFKIKRKIRFSPSH